jgi:hypothetical protein
MASATGKIESFLNRTCMSEDKMVTLEIVPILSLESFYPVYYSW